MGAYAIDFQYLLLNEKAYSKDQLLTIRNIVSTLFLAEGHYDIALLERELPPDVLLAVAEAVAAICKA